MYIQQEGLKGQTTGSCTKNSPGSIEYCILMVAKKALVKAARGLWNLLSFLLQTLFYKNLNYSSEMFSPSVYSDSVV